MKLIKLFEKFEENREYELFDIFWKHPNEVENLFIKELSKEQPNLNNISIFLESGLVDVNTNNRLGVPLIHLAVLSGDTRITQLFLDYGANIEDKRGDGQTFFSVSDKQRDEMFKDIQPHSGK